MKCPTCGPMTDDILVGTHRPLFESVLEHAKKAEPLGLLDGPVCYVWDDCMAPRKAVDELRKRWLEGSFDIPVYATRDAVMNLLVSKIADEM